MFGNVEFLMADDEAENVEKMWFGTPDKAIKLRCGASVNPKGIVAITEPDEIPIWGGETMNTDGTMIQREGRWLSLNTEQLSEVSYILAPKYNRMLRRIEANTEIIIEENNLVEN
ncbi:MAG: hypothetical protein HYS02_00060 [Candidatus Staskawiczbacteria bacterium]|nr:hypothetical protein [Candidatus Staskawiczbacteria bacterium]